MCVWFEMIKSLGQQEIYSTVTVMLIWSSSRLCSDEYPVCQIKDKVVRLKCLGWVDLLRKKRTITSISRIWGLRMFLNNKVSTAPESKYSTSEENHDKGYGGVCGSMQIFPRYVVMWCSHRGGGAWMQVHSHRVSVPEYKRGRKSLAKMSPSMTQSPNKDQVWRI